MFEQLPISGELISIFLSVLLGLFIGLEREWSNKPAGVRTFSLLATIGCTFAIIDNTAMLTAGVGFVITLSLLLGLQGIKQDIPTDDENKISDRDEFHAIGLSLTTSASLLITYSVGVLVGYNYLIEGVTIAVISSLLLALKEDLHSFAWDLSSDELRSAIEFSILAFVVYPLLPSEPVTSLNIVNPQLVWSLVIAISAIGFANYIIVKKYKEKGFAFTAFFGGLVNSTAVIVSLMDQSDDISEDPTNIALGAILLSNAAMSIRNAFLAIIFIPISDSIQIVLPLIAILISGVLLSYKQFTVNTSFNTDTLSSPFDLKVALSFGALFLAVLLVTEVARSLFGSVGIVGTQFLAGLISSGTSTTTVVSLFESGSITPTTAMYGIMSGTIASILVKIGFATKMDRSLLKPALLYNFALISVAVVTAIVVQMAI